MSHVTSAAVTGRVPSWGLSAGYRVIIHPPVCPYCGSDDVTDEEVLTGDGMTETARFCLLCGSCWPLACVCEWPADPPRPTA
jgi:hypothetical protein